MSKAAVQGNLIGFAPKPKPVFPVMGPSDKGNFILNPKPKPVFPVMGPSDKEYFILNPKPKPIHFMASLGHSGLGVLIMDVMGLGENGHKVPRGLDVAVSTPPPPSKSIRGGIYMCTKDSRSKKILVAYPKP
jgi:hypothetical protein